ncbi:MAG: NAD-dependent epimerase/dehydratase family protein [Gaiellaceae bacterium]
MTTVLVTGGAGFIGSHTVDLLLERGYRVRVLDSLQTRVHPRGKPSWVPSEAEFVEGDVVRRDDLARALAGVNAVFHLAAYQDYLPDFSTFIHVNTESSALLFELVVENPKRYPVEKIVFASSQAVSGEGKYSCARCVKVLSPGPRSLDQLRRREWEPRCDTCGGQLAPELIDEGTSHPHTAYGVSKYAIELLAFALGRRYGIAAAAMRYTYVQGPRNSFHNAYSGVARRFALRLRTGLAPVCYEDGGQLRDYVNVRDVAHANLVALESDVDGVALNVGGGRAVSVREFAEMMIQASGADVEPEIPGDFRVGDTRHTVSDISRMRALGWEPTVPVEQNVREYLDWLDTQDVATEQLFEAERELAATGVVQRAD